MLDCAKERTNSTLHCLKDKLDNLEGLVNNNSVVARSLTSTHTSVDSETSLNNELGRGSSDRYPQHDTSPVKIISSKYRPVRRISKPTQEVQQPPRTSVPSCTFASKPHHQTCPERTEQPKQGHTDNDSERLDDLMNSIQRLKEEKLAQIECSSPLTKLCNE
ncbi:uncharacterized protein LOC119739404 isoform X2 [Patiria miniata]|uniref:Uncharacterized protein n=1 Tax=Patiria miniata TaxID=46514 RepID=A0A914B1N3_PATMI|nr:uncharacterized protein LOC119739404 isoform X2 [Patiria miniata]